MENQPDYNRLTVGLWQACFESEKYYRSVAGLPEHYKCGSFTILWSQLKLTKINSILIIIIVYSYSPSRLIYLTATINLFDIYYCY